MSDEELQGLDWPVCVLDGSIGVCKNRREVNGMGGKMEAMSALW